MLIEEIRELSGEQVEARMEEIKVEIDADGADLETLNAEIDALKERKDGLIKEAEARKELAEKIATEKEPVEVKEIRKDENKMSNMELRNTPEYVHAFANYIKTGNDEECRALLTENATNGSVPVPEVVDNAIRHAWDNEPILSRVTKTFIKGNVKVGFEISATDAAVHAEGEEVTEENLVLGIVSLVPETIKKWISVSDEVLDMDDGAFLNYIYSEVSYKIMQKLAGAIVTDIINAPATATATAASVATSAATTAATTSIITAEGELSDEANDIVVICTKAVAAQMKAAALAANYGYDPFDGLTVLTSAAAQGHILVGDLKGVQVNFPNGENPSFKYDDNTLATKDLVRIIGRLPAAHGVVAPGRFVDIVLG